MAAAVSPHVTRDQLDELRDAQLPRQLTLLELIEAVSSVTSDDCEIVATVISMLRTGGVRLGGSFHDEPVSEIEVDAQRD
jgi:hypothetical protein